MARTTYKNFDVEIVREGEGYAARVHAPTGEARAAFTMPLSPQEVRILGLTVARGRKTARSVQTREVDEVKAYGQRLFESLFPSDLLLCYHESIAHVRGQPGTGLRVRLRLSGAPELAQVPWEYLFDRRSNRFLALEEETPIVRYLDLPLRAGVLEVQPPLRVLVMISSPEDVPGLDTDAEWSRLNEALGDLVQQGAVRLDRLENATVSDLRWRLKAEDYHVFHFIGHGGVDAISERGVLILEDEAGRSDVVDAEVVAGVLSAEKTLRLAVLNACEGGRASKGDIFAGTAQALVQQDVPAVIAMQFEISDEAAIALTHDFYKALSMGDPVDAALTEARRGLRFEMRNELEWGTPVLYMRASDGRLFDVKGKPAPAAAEAFTPRTQPPPPPRENEKKPKRAPATHEPVEAHDRSRERRIAELVHEAQVASFSEKWSVAAAKLEQALQLDPAHAEAAARLKEVRQEEQLATLFKTAADHEAAARFDAALDVLQRVRKLAEHDYRGVDARMVALRERTREAIPVKKKKGWSWKRAAVVGTAVWVVLAVIGTLIPDEPVDPYVFPAYEPPSTGTDVKSDFVEPDVGQMVGPMAEGPSSSEPASYEPAPETSSGYSGGYAPSRDAEAAASGLFPYNQPFLGTLEQTRAHIYDVFLEAGSTFVIAGSCDDSCGDLDLSFYELGIKMFEDVASDPMPVLTVSVIATATYQLHVDMASCDASLCAYRVQTYR